MQLHAPRSKPLTRVFVCTRTGARVRGALRATAATCVHAITRGRAVLVDVVSEADHVGDSTRSHAGLGDKTDAMRPEDPTCRSSRPPTPRPTVS
jgi:hypothetical protein